MYDTIPFTGTPTSVTNATDISGYQSPLNMLVLTLFLVPPENFNGWRFLTKVGLYVYKIYFVNRTTGIWSAPSFTNDECADKNTSVDKTSTSFSLNDYMSLLYRDIILRSPTILSG